MADPALDAESLRRDRDRYQGFLVQAEEQLANCSERIEQLHQAIDALDRLLALTAAGPIPGLAPTRPAPNGIAGPGQGDGAGGPGSEGDADPAEPAPRRRAAAKRGRRSAAATSAPSPTATPAAPEPVEPPGPSTAAPAPSARPTAAAQPKGTDALRLVLESEPSRTWSLSELLDALGARGWLPASRRPEEGVRISLKRLVERGGAVRVADGRWRHPAGDDQATPDGQAAPHEPAAADPAPPAAIEAPDAGPAMAAAAEAVPREPEPRPSPPPPPPPTAHPASFGRPVGATVTEL